MESLALDCKSTETPVRRFVSTGLGAASPKKKPVARRPVSRLMMAGRVVDRQLSDAGVDVETLIADFETLRSASRQKATTRAG